MICSTVVMATETLVNRSSETPSRRASESLNATADRVTSAALVPMLLAYSATIARASSPPPRTPSSSRTCNGEAWLSDTARPPLAGDLPNRATHQTISAKVNEFFITTARLRKHRAARPSTESTPLRQCLTTLVALPNHLNYASADDVISIRNTCAERGISRGADRVRIAPNLVGRALIRSGIHRCEGYHISAARTLRRGCKGTGNKPPREDERSQNKGRGEHDATQFAATRHAATPCQVLRIILPPSQSFSNYLKNLPTFCVLFTITISAVPFRHAISMTPHSPGFTR